MKILTVVYSLEKGGTQRSAQNFALAYKDIGHESKLLFTIEDGPRKDRLLAGGIDVESLNNTDGIRRLKGWMPDVVHFHSLGLTLECVELILKELRPKHVWETNVFSQPSPWEHLLDKSFQLSYWCKWLYLKRHGNPRKVAVVSNPVDTSSFFRESKEITSRARFELGCLSKHCIIGRLGQALDGKWSPYIIPIFEELRITFPHLRLLLVDPPASIRSQILISKFKSDVITLDSVADDRDLRKLYSIIDIFFHIAEQGESFGMVLAESLLCETPVVTLETPWGDNSQGEVVRDGLGGLVAKRVSDLPPLLKSLIINDELRAQMGTNGRSYIIENFNALFVARQALEAGLLFQNQRSQNANPIISRQANRIVKANLSWYESIFLLLEIPMLLAYTRGYLSWRRYITKKIYQFFLFKANDSQSNRKN